MKKNYPVSLPVRFEDFPSMFKVTCGQLIPSPYSFGSRVLVQRTPLCGVVQGQYVEGSALPEFAMIYSDTGSDAAYDLKLSFYGWGTFYVVNTGDKYCALEIRKGIKVEVSGLSKKFETYDVWETFVPASLVLTDPPQIKTVSIVYTETPDSDIPRAGYVRVENVFYNSDNETIKLRGTLLLGGDGTMWWKDE